MLKQIHQYSSKNERKTAFNAYKRYNDSIIYKHVVPDDDQNQIERRCSKYVYHVEKMLGKPIVVKSIQDN